MSVYVNWRAAFDIEERDGCDMNDYVVAISEDGTTELVQVSAPDSNIVFEGRYRKEETE